MCEVEKVQTVQQRMDIQDEGTPGGVFQDLPPELLKMVLEKLPPGEIIKTRQLSKWYEEVVTNMFSSLFDTFTISHIYHSNCPAICGTLAKAILKPHNKDTKQKLKFEEELTPLMKQMLIICKNFIVALDIKIFGGEDFLLEPSLTFYYLESLTIKTSSRDPIKERSITESLIGKHASKLKKICVQDDVNKTYENIMDDLHLSLNVSALPNLLSLTMAHVDVPLDFPVMPQLIELKIVEREEGRIRYNLHMLSKCKESLKCLVSNCEDIQQILDENALVMPQLTDLFVIQYVHCDKFLSYNQKSLEFLFLYDCTLSANHQFGIRLERVKTVVMRNVVFLDEEDDTKIEMDKAMMAEYCPNAEIFIWNEKNEEEMKELVKSYHRSRGFTLDLNDIFH